MISLLSHFPKSLALHLLSCSVGRSCCSGQCCAGRGPRPADRVHEEKEHHSSAASNSLSLDFPMLAVNLYFISLKILCPDKLYAKHEPGNWAITYKHWALAVISFCTHLWCSVCKALKKELSECNPLKKFVCSTRTKTHVCAQKPVINSPVHAEVLIDQASGHA